MKQNSWQADALCFPSPPGEGGSKGREEQWGKEGKGRMRLSPAGLQLVQQGFPISKGTWEQPSKEKYGMRLRCFGLQGRKSFGWLDFLFLSHPANLAFCFSSPKSTSAWQGLVYSSKEQHLSKWPCVSQQAALEGLQQGRTSVWGLSALSRVNLWLQTPSLSPRHSVNRPAKAPITRAFPFPGAGDLPGGIQTTAFLRQCVGLPSAQMAWGKTYFSLDSSALFTWFLCWKNLHQSYPSRFSGEMQTKFLQTALSSY